MLSRHLPTVDRHLPTGDASDRDLEDLNELLRNLPPQELLVWAWETYAPAIAATSSFQTQSLPLLHMIATETPNMPVWFLDTGFHFQETLAFRDRVAEELRLKLNVVKPPKKDGDLKHHEGNLYHHNPDLCCYIHKVEPLKAARRELRAWITGIRRDQTHHRRSTPILSRLPEGIYKVCPLARWTRDDVGAYIRRYGLPEHPLLSQGYLSIGCAPCTRPTLVGEDERGGRWADSEKTECGLHLDRNQQKRS